MTKKERDFVPAPGLSNNHLMTLAPLVMIRRFPLTSRGSERLLLEVAPGNQVLVKLHRAPQTAARADYLVLVLHGLESNADVHYVKGVCEKAIYDGFSVARMNMRNCGGTSHLATTLYNAGMSEDVLSVASQLSARYGFKGVFLCGFSLGGNVVLKAAGEYAAARDREAQGEIVASPAKGPRQSGFLLAGVCAVCPPIDLEGCVRQMEKGVNRIYEKNFVLSLKMRIYEKARHFPGRYDLVGLREIKTVRGFDSAFTAPDAGYGSAEEYYYNASAQRVLAQIDCPALIIAAQDDPLVPFSCFESLVGEGSGGTENFRGTLLAPLQGGHVSFVHKEPVPAGIRPGRDAPSDQFWAEWQALNFFKNHTAGGA
ncbi:MAG: alpha/beta fold hydrolase [Cyanobacteria bacterium REEB67]|nr:alpha/beta fold hydrolase [Cyanobacteria bacterium REEB67]